MKKEAEHSTTTYIDKLWLKQTEKKLDFCFVLILFFFFFSVKEIGSKTDKYKLCELIKVTAHPAF